MTELERTFADAQVALAGIPSSVGPIVGLIVVFGSEGDALAFGQHIANYMTAEGSRRRAFDVSFERTGDSYRLMLENQLDDTRLRIQVEAVDPGVPTGLVDSLRSRLYYFVVAGVKDEEAGVRLVRPEDTHAYKRDIRLDGAAVAGQGTWPAEDLF